MPLTITEALQEIKTIGSRITKKQDAVTKYIARDGRVRDPFEKDGGSEKWVRQERQAIQDLESRIIELRIAIQKANLSNTLTIGETAKTVSEWLTWRREVAPRRKLFLNSLFINLENLRKSVQQKGGKMVSVGAAASVNMDSGAPPEIVVELNEQELIKAIETMEETLGALDGRLSLFNATTTI